jgi:acyl carrier protein
MSKFLPPKVWRDTRLQNISAGHSYRYFKGTHDNSDKAIGDYWLLFIERRDYVGTKRIIAWSHLSFDFVRNTQCLSYRSFFFNDIVSDKSSSRSYRPNKRLRKRRFLGRESFLFCVVFSFVYNNCEVKNMAVIDTVKTILGKRVDVSSFSEEGKLVDLGLDSLDLVEVMIEIEEEVGVEFSSDEIAHLVTLKDVVDLVNSKSK